MGRPEELDRVLLSEGYDETKIWAAIHQGTSGYDVLRRAGLQKVMDFLLRSRSAVSEEGLHLTKGLPSVDPTTRAMTDAFNDFIISSKSEQSWYSDFIRVLLTMQFKPVRIAYEIGRRNFSQQDKRGLEISAHDTGLPEIIWDPTLPELPKGKYPIRGTNVMDMDIIAELIESGPKGEVVTNVSESKPPKKIGH